ncbi:MAG: Crp/Fnr family transcriptional regulator [Burkholderiaceae bacterium]
MNNINNETQYPSESAARERRFDTLARLGTRQVIPRHKVFIFEGERSTSAYLILSGLVQTFSSADPDRQIIFGTHGSGDVVGAVALDGEPRIASARAVQETQVAVVSRAQLLQFLSTEPAFAIDLLHFFALRLRQARKGMQNLVFLDNYARLRELLLASAVEANDATARLTHREIATAIGCSRVMVSKLLKELTERGYIARGRGEIRVLKPMPDHL